MFSFILGVIKASLPGISHVACTGRYKLEQRRQERKYQRADTWSTLCLEPFFLHHSLTTRNSVHVNSMHAIAPLCIPFFIYRIITSYGFVPQAGSNSLRPQPLSLANTNTSNNNPTLNASLSIDASNLEISCFDHVPTFLPVNMANYFAAVQQILLREDALVPRPFYLGPSLDVRWEWTGGAIDDDRRCIIVLYNKLPLLTDMFPIILIAQVAAMIADKCITAASSYAGGWASPGVGRGVIAVVNARSNGVESDDRVSTERWFMWNYGKEYGDTLKWTTNWHVSWMHDTSFISVSRQNRIQWHTPRSVQYSVSTKYQKRNRT